MQSSCLLDYLPSISRKHSTYNTCHQHIEDPEMSASTIKSSNGKQVSKPVLQASSLYVKVKYNNTLPDIPFDPKFLVNPLNINRFVEYQTTSLERDSKHELLTTPHLGVDIDLIPPERYAIPMMPEHDVEDEKLLNDDEPIPDKSKKSVRDKPHSQLHNKVVPWLKKTEYISTEFNRYGSSNEKTETKVGYNVRKSLKEEEVYLDKDSQIKAIEATFEAARKPINKHPTKPGVHAVRVLPLLPDFDKWKYNFAYVKFDGEPRPTDASKEGQMSQAFLKGAYDEEAKENYVMYFLPTEITMANRLVDQSNDIPFTEGKEYEYKSTRDYSWSARSDKTDDFFFVFRDDAVYYNRLSMEVVLKKRRIKNQSTQASTAVVKYREENDEELAGQVEKMKELSKPEPVVRENLDLTAQALEQSYEEMAQERKSDIGGGDQPEENAASAESENDNEDAMSTSSTSSSAGSSSQESSSSLSEESGDDDSPDD